MPVLQGRIVHRVNLNDSSSEILLSRKRKRKRKADSRASNDVGVAKNDAPLAGFVFLASSPTDSTEYLLSVPFVLLQTVCEAVICSRQVSLSRYRLVSLFQTNGPDSNCSLLELFTDGLVFIDDSRPPPISAIDSVLSLTAFRHKEIVEGQDMKSSKRKNTSYDIIATIDAITPVIAIDPSDPFALVELCDKQASCILVMSGHLALIWHAAMQPGDTIVFQGLWRKPWQVPNVLESKPAFAHLGVRIPKWVFLLSTTATLQWRSSSGCQVNQEGRWGLLPSPPSTAVPLVSLQGRVTDMVTTVKHHDSTKARIIQWVDLTEMEGGATQQSKAVRRLFLSQFPMSTALQLCLKIGAIIRAVNVHALDSIGHKSLQAYGACLRSTVTLMLGATEVHECLQGTRGVSQGETVPYETRPHQPIFAEAFRSTDQPSLEGVVPYRLGFLKVSYDDLLWKKQAKEWLEECFGDSDNISGVAPLPTASALVSVLRRKGKKDLCDTIEAKRAQKVVSRNPYAEFFDHAFQEGTLLAYNKNQCGCSISRDESSFEGRPMLMGLNQIRMAGLELLVERFSSLIEHDTVSRGWTGSIHLSQEDVASKLGVGGNDTLEIGGFISELNQKKKVLSVSDSICQLPLTFLEPNTCTNGDFVLAPLDRLIVSCFCLMVPRGLDTAPRYNEVFDSVHLRSLPPIRNRFFNRAMGGGALVKIGSYLLVASVQLLCREQSLVLPANIVDRNAESTLPVNDDISLELCLKSPGSWEHHNGSIQGLLVRSRFRHAKVNSNGISNSLVMTITDINDSSAGASPLCIQSLNVKVAVPHDKSMSVAFKRVLNEMLSEEMQLMDDECALGTAWWSIAESSASPIVAGGWDEYKAGSSSGHIGVSLSIPRASFSSSSRGYVRCSCSLESVGASFTEIDRRDDLGLELCCPKFDFVGAGRFFDGMLCRRLHRKKMAIGMGRTSGERLDPLESDMPQCSISNLFRLACLSIQHNEPSILAPSLVRRLSSANFLGVMYCEVACKCGCCFSPLAQVLPEGNGRSNNCNLDEPSFWDQPVPGDLSFVQEQPQPRAVRWNMLPQFVSKSRLRCPNKCPIASYKVHWECSGFLDDGSGQAKLYAERETALTLLGLTKEEIEEIEKGIWDTSNGILRYSKAIPPSKHLWEQVQMAAAKGRGGCRDPLSLLSPSTRAEYLLFHHCRSSRRPSRKLSYLVQCKPLSDNIRHLNHTTIDLFGMAKSLQKQATWSEVSSYSLPPLKLELVDCCAP